jgi:hypothetical protein
LNGTDRCREAGSGAELVCDQEDMVSDFHACLTAAGLEFMKKSSTILSPEPEFQDVELTARMRCSKVTDPARAPSYCATLVSRPRNSMPFAAGQLAVFQGGPSRTGGSDEHI